MKLLNTHDADAVFVELIKSNQEEEGLNYLKNMRHPLHDAGTNDFTIPLRARLLDNLSTETKDELLHDIDRETVEPIKKPYSYNW